MTKHNAKMAFKLILFLLLLASTIGYNEFTVSNPTEDHAVSKNQNDTMITKTTNALFSSTFTSASVYMTYDSLNLDDDYNSSVDTVVFDFDVFSHATNGVVDLNLTIDIQRYDNATNTWKAEEIMYKNLTRNDFFNGLSLMWSVAWSATTFGTFNFSISVFDQISNQEIYHDEIIIFDMDPYDGAPYGSMLGQAWSWRMVLPCGISWVP